jgi:hypothetical protein
VGGLSTLTLHGVKNGLYEGAVVYQTDVERVLSDRASTIRSKLLGLANLTNLSRSLKSTSGPCPGNITGTYRPNRRRVQAIRSGLL